MSSGFCVGSLTSLPAVNAGETGYVAEGEKDCDALDEPPEGYVLAQDQRAEDVLAVQAELLCKEGTDPAWPGFPGKQRRSQD